MSWFARRLRDDKGAALVEFALVLPVFFLIVLGSMSAIWLVGERSHVSGIARDLARYASIRHDPRSCHEPVCPNGYPSVEDLRAYAEAKHYVGRDGVGISLGCGTELERSPLLETPTLETPTLLPDVTVPEVSTPELRGPYSGPWRNDVLCVTVTRAIPDPFGGIASLIGIDDITYTSTAKARIE